METWMLPNFIVFIILSKFILIEIFSFYQHFDANRSFQFTMESNICVWLFWRDLHEFNTDHCLFDTIRCCFIAIRINLYPSSSILQNVESLLFEWESNEWTILLRFDWISHFRLGVSVNWYLIDEQSKMLRLFCFRWFADSANIYTRTFIMVQLFGGGIQLTLTLFFIDLVYASLFNFKVY